MRRFFHTPSTVPERVRQDVVRGWNSLWNKLRRWDRRDRGLEFKVGTPLRVAGTEYRIKWLDRDRQWELSLPGGSTVRRVDGSCAFGDSKPYTYLDDLQDALDELVVEEVLSA